MNTQRMIAAFAIALLISGACTYALSLKMHSKSAAKSIPDQRVYAPVKPLETGEILKPENIELVNWPASLPLTGAFSHPEQVVGRTVLYPVDKGQPLTERLVSAAGAGPGLAGHIPEGMRAISVRSDEVMGVSGFLMPGSHVDMLVTYHSDRLPEPETATVLQDVVVLATGRQLQADPNSKEAAPAVITLLLGPEDAERAVMASTQGSVHFIMRSGSDRATSAATPVLLSQLSGAPLRTAQPVQPVRPSSLTPAAPAQPKPEAGGYTVETTMGDKTSHDTFSTEGKR